MSNMIEEMWAFMEKSRNTMYGSASKSTFMKEGLSWLCYESGGEYGNGKKQNMSSLWELGLQLLQYSNMIYGSHIDKSKTNLNVKVLGVFTWVNGNQGYGFTS